MPIAIIPSIRDIAGKHPFRLYGQNTKNAVGAFQDTIFTPPPDQTFEITLAWLYYTAGTDTSYFQMMVFDGTNYGVIFRGYNVGVNVSLGGVCDVSLSSCLITLLSKGTASTQPFTYSYSLIGWYYERGEGNTD